MPQRTKLFIIAGLLGLVAATLTYVYLGRRASEANREIRVITARMHISSGTVLEAGMLQARTFKLRDLPSKSMIDPNAVVGKVAILDIMAGQPITLMDLSQRYRLAQIVEPAMRAVSVAIDPVTGVAGFLKPGDHVDVVATFTVGGGTVTKTILQDIKVIAIGPDVVNDPDTPSPDAGRPAKAAVQNNATLLATPMDAERLVLAANKGRLCLLLRRPDDTSYVSPGGVTSRAVVGRVPPDVPPAVAPKPPRSVVAAPAHPRPYRSASASSAGIIPAMPMTMEPLPAMTRQEPKIEHGHVVQVIRGTKVENTEVSR